MKANRKFIEENEAVSAVIGVILMVAITVAIAATVYYYVTTMMPQGGETSPTFQLRIDDLEDRLIVTTADTSADWNRLAFTQSNVAGTAIHFHLNGAAVGGDPTVASDGTQQEIATTQDLMSATEYIEFAGVAAVTEVEITIIDTTANQEIGSYLFTDIAIV